MRIAKEPKSSHWPFFSGGSWGDEVVEEGTGELDGRALVREEASVGIETPRRMAVVIAEERRVLVGVALFSSEASKPAGGSIYSLSPSSSVVVYLFWAASKVLLPSYCLSFFLPQTTFDRPTQV